MIVGIDANEANISRRVGVNQYAFGLLHALNKLESDHKFVIYLKDTPLPDMPPVRKNWQYRVIPFPRLWTQTRLPWDLYIHKPRPDVFFTPSHYSPRWSPVPTVISIMDLGFLQTRNQFTAKDFNQLKNWTAYSVKKASRIISISEFTKKDIITNFKKKPEDIAVTYPGFDTQLFRPTRNRKVLNKYGLKQPYLLFLSSLKPSKNVEGLIKAYAGLDKREMSLVIAGKKAWLYESIFKLVSELKLEKQVIFTGFVKDDEVPVLMTAARAFILPSFYEGFGIPVAEAMACGTPVVVSRIASLPEVAGEAGIYVDPGDINSISAGITTAIGPDRNKFVRLGLLEAKKFSWEKTARETLRVLETV